MSEWRALHAYTTDIEPLLKQCIGPFFARHEGDLEHGFWERHYAGGPHVRIRLKAEASRLGELVAELERELSAHFERHPSPDIASYSAQRAAQLLEKEGLSPTPEELEYHNNMVLEQPYPLPGRVYASEGARALAEGFRRASGPLALAILDSPRPRREGVLCLSLALALYVGKGSYAPGCVSYKSHWEGFSVTFPSEEVIARVRQSYAQNRERLRQLLHEVAAGHAEAFSADPLVASWWRILRSSEQQARAMFAAGEALTDHPETPEAAAAIREKLFTVVRRQSDFVEKLWADERFVTLLRHDVSFHVPRVLVNLLYDLVAAVGLSPIDKMAMCHHTYRVVEEALDCDLNELLERNIAAVIERHAHRLEKAAAAEAARS